MYSPPNDESLWKTLTSMVSAEAGSPTVKTDVIAMSLSDVIVTQQKPFLRHFYSIEGAGVEGMSLGNMDPLRGGKKSTNVADMQSGVLLSLTISGVPQD